MEWASLMPDRTVQDFPIFPLGLVALPYEFAVSYTHLTLPTIYSV